MTERAQQTIQTIPDTHLALFATRLTAWLIADLNKSDTTVPDFTESRAKALLKTMGVIDDATLHDFANLMTKETAVRLALYDLLNDAALAEDEEVQTLAAATGALSETALAEAQASVSWLPLAIAAHAWKTEYPLHQLDPASPPGEYSPAGQLVKRAATFMRQQIQRSATERDKLARKIAYRAGTAASGTPSLEQMSNQPPIAPVPPHFRPPIPVRYPEVARETLNVEPDEPAQSPVSRQPQITITDEDLSGSDTRPVRMPSIRITRDQVNAAQTPARRPNRQRPLPASSGGNTALGHAIQNRIGRKEPLKSTKLRITVREVQGGPGLYGVQVRVSCQGYDAFVAGTTNQEGIFLCELPVRVQSGLTYDVDITWPRDLAGEVERKSITLNADRTEFTLPFYLRLPG